jgi:hypothetical protein
MSGRNKEYVVTDKTGDAPNAVNAVRKSYTAQRDQDMADLEAFLTPKQFSREPSPFWKNKV